MRTIAERFLPDLPFPTDEGRGRAGWRVGAAGRVCGRDTASWVPMPALVDSNHALVGDYGPRLLHALGVMETEGEDEWRAHHGPHREVRAALGGVGKVANLEHCALHGRGSNGERRTLYHGTAEGLMESAEREPHSQAHTPS